MHEMTTEAIGNMLTGLHRQAIGFGLKQPPSLHVMFQWNLPKTPGGGWRKEVRVRDVGGLGERWATHPQRVAGVLTDVREELRAAGPPPGLPRDARVIAWALLSTDIAVNTEHGGEHVAVHCADAVDVDGKVYKIRTADRALRHGELDITTHPEPGLDHFVGHEQLSALFDLGRRWR
ncbi:hypothetical protein [Longispora albida]|uniref:hypothetical protein n=1 Tax=Longispora albida TaxID=203523 RepID=UPI00037960E4|nr:hypothetical protein [Longispora albida]